MVTIGDVLSERGARYGTFESNATVSQAIKRILYQELTLNPHGPADAVIVEALAMISHKLARIVCGDPTYVDSLVDIAGYATLAANWLSEQQQAVRKAE